MTQKGREQRATVLISATGHKRVSLLVPSSVFHQHLAGWAAFVPSTLNPSLVLLAFFT